MKFKEYESKIQMCNFIFTGFLLAFAFTVKAVKSNPVTCEVCEMAMKYLDSMLSNNSTEEEIKKGLDQLCGYLPSSAQQEVISFLFICSRT